MTSKRLRSLLLLLLCGVVTASSVPALTVDFSFQFISSSTTYSNGSGGGEYTLAQLDGLDNSAYSPLARDLGWSRWDSSVQTFCLEKLQHVRHGQTYGGVLSDGAVPGLPGGVNGIDYLSNGTVYLYSQFAQGLLNGYRFTGTSAERRADAYRLQRIIWSLEGESVGGVTSDPWYIEAASYASDKGGVTADAIGAATLGVKVINNLDVNEIGAPFTDANQNRQDFLYYEGFSPIPSFVPDGGSSVLLLGTALGSLAGASRIRRRCTMLQADRG